MQSTDKSSGLPAALLGGRRIDLVTPRFLNPRLRERVLARAEPQHPRVT